MEKNYISATLERKGEKIEFIASDETLDRQGEVIPIDSWDLRNFKKNPVLLVNHDYKVQNIVGRAKNIRIADNGSGTKVLMFEPTFHGLTQLARDVEQMVRESILNTVSVGFMRKMPDHDGDKQLNELMEISFVPVPANPSAERIKSLMNTEISAEEEAAIKAFAEGDDTTIKEGRVLSAKSKRLVENAIDALQALLDESENGKGSKQTKVQTLICSKKRFEGANDAKKWANDHDFRSDKVDETEDSWRLRQMEPSMCREDSFRTINLDDGVDAVVCRPTEDGLCALGTQSENDASGHGENDDTPKPSKGKAGKGRAGGKNMQVRILQRFAKEINSALYQAKKQRDG